MTAYELLDLAASYQSLMHGWITTIFTTMAAYMVVAYVVGKNLTTFQVAVISFAFTFFSGLCIFATYGTASRALEFFEAAKVLDPTINFAVSKPIIWASLTALSIGVGVALLFMRNVRSRGSVK